MMRAPEPRYRVVERGRRLEVIDNQTGKRVSHAPPPAPVAGSAPTRPEKAPAGVDDGTVFTTQRWYDNKAPRTIRLDFATKARLDQTRTAAALGIAVVIGLCVLFWPVAIVVLGFAAAPGTRKWVRGAITGWLDTLSQR
jgi:hypothetical protein